VKIESKEISEKQIDFKALNTEDYKTGSHFCVTCYWNFERSAQTYAHTTYILINYVLALF